MFERSMKKAILLAVEDLIMGMHIGNLKIYNIRNEGKERIAEYSRFIGEKSFWGLRWKRIRHSCIELLFQRNEQIKL